MKELHFKPEYKDEITNLIKYTTFRLGDKTGKYEVGEIVLIILDYPDGTEKPLCEAIIKRKGALLFMNIKESDLRGEATNLRTLDSLKAKLEEIYGEEIQGHTVVSRIDYISRINEMMNKYLEAIGEYEILTGGE